MEQRLWRDVNTADIPKLEQIMDSVDPGSQKWLRAKVRLEKLRQEQLAADTQAQHSASHTLGSCTLRWTIVAAIAAIIGAVAAIIAIFR
jgi:hypothetical protein